MSRADDGAAGPSATLRIYLTLQEVSAATTLSEALIQKLVREELFPRPRALSGRRVGWLVQEVAAWCADRPVSDLLPPANTARRATRARAPRAADPAS